MADRAVAAHWNHAIDNFSASSEEFYVAVEQAVRRRQPPDAQLSRVKHAEGGMFSSKREYLRVTRGDLIFDICAAPFGTTFFFSYWLTTPANVRRGGLLNAMFKPETFYKMDVESMFQAVVHAAVLEVIDGMTTAKGVRALTESERKPVLPGLMG